MRRGHALLRLRFTSSFVATPLLFPARQVDKFILADLFIVLSAPDTQHKRENMEADVPKPVSPSDNQGSLKKRVVVPHACDQCRSNHVKCT